MALSVCRTNCTSTCSCSSRCSSRVSSWRWPPACCCGKQSRRPTCDARGAATWSKCCTWRGGHSRRPPSHLAPPPAAPATAIAAPRRCGRWPSNPRPTASPPSPPWSSSCRRAPCASCSPPASSSWPGGPPNGHAPFYHPRDAFPPFCSMDTPIFE
jgi:hypothetical protein